MRYNLHQPAVPLFDFDDVRDGVVRVFVTPVEDGQHRLVAVVEEGAAERALLPQADETKVRARGIERSPLTKHRKSSQNRTPNMQNALNTH